MWNARASVSEGGPRNGAIERPPPSRADLTSRSTRWRRSVARSGTKAGEAQNIRRSAKDLKGARLALHAENAERVSGR